MTKNKPKTSRVFFKLTMTNAFQALWCFYLSNTKQTNFTHKIVKVNTSLNMVKDKTYEKNYEKYEPAPLVSMLNGAGWSTTPSLNPGP